MACDNASSSPGRMIRLTRSVQSMKTAEPHIRQFFLTLWLLVLIQTCACNSPVASEATASVAGGSIAPATLAVIVNDADPLSRRIGAYYAQQRHIPEKNLIHVSFATDRPVMTRGEFKQVMATVNARVPPSVQAYALAWTEPYRVGCMSITTAFAAGYDEAFCAKGCKATQLSPYFNTDSRRPHKDYGWRPAMLLAGRNFDDAKQLIDRGVAADGTRPRGTGYLVSTSDTARNVRSRFYPGIVLMQSDRFSLKNKKYKYNTLSYKYNVLLHWSRQGERDRYQPLSTRRYCRSSDIVRRAADRQQTDEQPEVAGSGRNGKLRHSGGALRVHAEVSTARYFDRPLPERRNTAGGLLEECRLAGTGSLYR